MMLSRVTKIIFQNPRKFNMISIEMTVVKKVNNLIQLNHFQGEVYYGDILESSQIVCAAEMSPHSAKFSWTFKVAVKK